MNEQIKSLLSQGEGISVEFKECSKGIGNSVYETVCAFLNAKGGDILLGVNDNGEVVGISKEKAESLKQNFVNSVNNTSKLAPTFCLNVDKAVVNGKSILHIFVPESSQVHRCNSRIFIRNNSGDFDITDKNQEVSNLYLRKQSSYSENKIFPYADISDLRIDLIDRVRQMAVNHSKDHPWQNMSDMDILKTTSLRQRDLQTDQEGLTLAGILLFGKDVVISAAVPAFRIDLIKRVDNVDRYDDRLDLRTNLIEAYEKTIEFVNKHLPDPFYLDEKYHRVSLRDAIFREVVANMIVHKEYLGGEPTKLVIEQDKVFTENSNRPYIHGIVSLSNLKSHPKNPNIAKIFRQIGRVEELGSGVRKLYKFCKLYCGYNPIISDNDLFKFELKINFFSKLTPQDTMHVGMQVAPQDTMHVGMQDENRERRILFFCKTPKTRNEIQQYVKIKNRDYFRRHILNPLIVEGKLELTMPDKPKSRNQRYISKPNTMHVGMQVAPQDIVREIDKEKAILSFCAIARTRNEIQNYVKIKNREYFRRDILNSLIVAGKLKLTIPDKPKSKNQKYISK
ncbi:MAG: putative DNA binding domain-containing protein [Endomicrobium sp.]|jgi:ATP-dependent DNA helicase RecG|nr:putative DNA binding domain-containing protein [Endomicrobium sp.]